MNLVIFACVHNAGRSQMAAAFFNELADPQLARAQSAGTQPASRVHPEALAIMSEFGIDLSGIQPHLLDIAQLQRARLLVTLGCGEQCPYLPGLETLDWPLLDPKGQSLEMVREIAREVRERVVGLIAERGWR